MGLIEGRGTEVQEGHQDGGCVTTGLSSSSTNVPAPWSSYPPNRGRDTRYDACHREHKATGTGSDSGISLQTGEGRLGPREHPFFPEGTQ